MFRIGDFAQLTQVTVKALRHYDRLGLLKPARVDSVSGYRYYSADQLPRLERIVALRELGFTLAHIAKLLNEEVTSERLRGLLEHKRRVLEAEVAEKRALLDRLEARLRQIEMEGRVNYTLTLKRVEPQLVASVRDVATAYTIGSLYREVFAYLERVGVKPAGPIMAVQYKMFADRSFDIDAAVPLAEDVSGSEDGRVKVWTLPGIEQAACTVHRGDFSDVGQAYRAIMGWLEENSYTKTGPVRAVYLELGNKRMTHGPEVTELQLPVAKS